MKQIIPVLIFAAIAIYGLTATYSVYNRVHTLETQPDQYPELRGRLVDYQRSIESQLAALEKRVAVLEAERYTLELKAVDALQEVESKVLEEDDPFKDDP